MKQPASSQGSSEVANNEIIDGDLCGIEDMTDHKIDDDLLADVNCLLGCDRDQKKRESALFLMRSVGFHKVL